MIAKRYVCPVCAKVGVVWNHISAHRGGAGGRGAAKRRSRAQYQAMALKRWGKTTTNNERT